MNNFSFTISTVNGSGSQSANNILLKSLFRKGYPVSGKNIFPSNIAGLPTTYSIRINKEGFTSFENEKQLLVSMNASTLKQDMSTLKKGSVIIYNSNLKIDDSIFSAHHQSFGVPFKNLAREISKSPNMVKFLTNMIYVGVLSHCLDLEVDHVHQVINDSFANKPAVVENNQKAMLAGYEYAKENIDFKVDLFKPDTSKNKDKVLIDGNTASALGLIYGGCNFMSWYPITPSSSVAEQYEKYAKTLLTTDENQSQFACLQAEDELSAISMVLGAGWSGARAVTPTSGPGLSLMAEAAGLSYFAEIPAVIWDVQRAGPSTGLPTRTMQGDLSSAYHLSHGDTEHIVLIPGTPAECFEMGEISLNLSEELQTLVIVLSDLDLGMNQWISPEIECQFQPWKRGKVLQKEDLEKLESFQRYEDIDKDGVCYRTLPGTNHASAGYFTRGTGHDTDASYSENPEVFEALLQRLKFKIENAKNQLPAPQVQDNKNDVGILCYGSSEPAALEALNILKREHKINCDYLRIKALPFHDQVQDFLTHHKKVFVIDVNRDGQMHRLILQKFPQFWNSLTSITHFNGLPVDAQDLSQNILTHLSKDPS